MAAWKTCKLGEVAEVNPETYKATDRWEKVYYLDTGSITDGKIDSFQIFSSDGLPSRARRKVKAGDIVFSTVRPALRHFGRLFQPPKNTLVSTGFAVIRGKSGVSDTGFLYYWLAQPWVCNFLHALGAQQAATYPAVSDEDVRSLNVSLPSLSEQERIAGVLGAYDDLIAVNARRMALLEEAAHRLYRERFVTHADPAWPSRPLGEVAEGEHTNLAWRKCPLGELASVTMGQSPESCNYNVEQVGLPFHQGVGTFGAWFPQEEVYTSKYSREAYAGDILFSVRAPVGRINLADKHCAIGRGVAAIRSVSGRQAFLFQLLREAFVREDMIGNGAIFASVSKDDLLRLEVAVPPEHVEADLDKQLTPYFEAVGVLARENALLREARDGLLPRLLREEA